MGEAGVIASSISAPPPRPLQASGGRQWTRLLSREAEVRQPPAGVESGFVPRDLTRRFRAPGNGPNVLSVARRRYRRAARGTRLCRSVRPGRDAARRYDRGRLQRWFAHIWPGGGLDGAADGRQRAAPLWVERVLQLALSRGPRWRAQHGRRA